MRICAAAAINGDPRQGWTMFIQSERGHGHSFTNMPIITATVERIAMPDLCVDETYALEIAAFVDTRVDEIERGGEVQFPPPCSADAHQLRAAALAAAAPFPVDAMRAGSRAAMADNRTDNPANQCPAPLGQRPSAAFMRNRSGLGNDRRIRLRNSVQAPHKHDSSFVLPKSLGLPPVIANRGRRVSERGQGSLPCCCFHRAYRPIAMRFRRQA